MVIIVFGSAITVRVISVPVPLRILNNCATAVTMIKTRTSNSGFPVVVTVTVFVILLVPIAVVVVVLVVIVVAFGIAIVDVKAAFNSFPTVVVIASDTKIFFNITNSRLN